MRLRRLPIAFIALLLNVPLAWTQTTDTQWLTTSSLDQARQRHSATLLSDGRVLVAGGAYDFWGEKATATCEIYDPATETWSAAAPMTEARSSHIAILLNDGRVFVNGGYAGNGYALASSEIYDPTSDTWTAIASMNTRRYRHAAAILNDDQIIIVGGRQGNIDGGSTMDIWAPLASCEIYSISQDTWTEAGAMNQTRVECGLAALPDGRILAAGGINDKLDIGNWAQPSTASCEIYDPVTDTWSYTDAFQSARNYLPLVTLDDNTVLSIGGELNKAALKSCEAFNPSRDRWTNAGEMNDPRIIAQVLKLPTGDVVTIGGWSYLWSSQTASTEAYRTTSGTWKALPDMHLARGWHSATLLTTGDILVAGGTTTDKSAQTSCELLQLARRGTFRIFAVSDVPNDNGGHARVYWSSHTSDASTAGTSRIDSYDIYLKDEANGTSVPELPNGNWRIVATIPATGQAHYSAIVPTIATGTSSSPSYSTFSIVATTKSGTRFASEQQTGQSFDNQGPAAIENLRVTQAEKGTTLQWSASPSSDVERYAIYRGDSPTFAIDPDHQIGTTSDLTYTDNTSLSEEIYYRVRAIDRAGNPGTGSPVATAQTSGAVTNTEGTVIGRNYPQPFSTETTIPITVSSNAKVSVEVIDILAQPVMQPRQLALQAGQHNIRINGSALASGQYSCVITIGSTRTVVPLVVQK